MDFEKAYQKFLNGTASAEETEFVRSEMKKANEINELLNQTKHEALTNPAEEATVKKAIKLFWRKDILKTLLIVSISVAILAVGIALAIGIPILTTARNNINYTAGEAEAIAIEYLAEQSPETEGIEVYKCHKELEVEGRIKNARYIYVLDVYNGVNEILEIEIDSKTGKIIEVD